MFKIIFKIIKNIKMSLILPSLIFFDSVYNLLPLELYKYVPKFLAEIEKPKANLVIFVF